VVALVMEAEVELQVDQNTNRVEGLVEDLKRRRKKRFDLFCGSINIRTNLTRRRWRRRKRWSRRR
jgi:hypothetical protein